MLSSTSRPVCCHFCGKPLYYFEDLRYVPEYVVEFRDPKKAIELDHKTITRLFVHQSCWNTLLMYPKHIWKQNDGTESINTE